jgi:Flp pilus assembly protein TadB
MRTKYVQIRIGGSGPGLRQQPTGFLAKVATTAVGAVVLVAAFVFSLLVVAVVAAVGSLLVGYLWWKTRGLRRRFREQPPGGRVIEGEAIRDVEPRDRIQR